MKLSHNQQAFFSLVKAGLWENEARLSLFDSIDYSAIFQLAEEQAVVGLVAAGLDHTVDVNVPKKQALTFVGRALQIEQRNIEMNSFVARLFKKLSNAGVYALLVKGQGIAQCYERPRWRAAGDVDLFLDSEYYKKALSLLSEIASSIGEECPKTNHFAMTIDSWEVELHGTLRSRLGKRIDRVIDEVQKDTFTKGTIRSWNNMGTDVFIPAPDNDVIFVFSHILQHFFREGVGLRQICDWCRLIWTYRDSLNVSLLENRLERMGVMAEWKTFAYLAVNSLGMPKEAMPFYCDDRKWRKNAGKVLTYIMETGNFGRKKDKSYYKKYPFFVYKTISLWKHTVKGIKHFLLFPSVSMHEWIRMITEGFKVAAKQNKQLSQKAG